MVRELEYILTIAEEKNITRAAQKLNITQSSLSQFLSAFETNLGTKLFVRTSAGTLPTYSGELFLEYAQKAVYEYRQVCNRLNDVNHLMEGQIRFAVGPERCCRLIPPILKRFREQYPNIHVDIEQRISNECLALLADGTVDIALLAVSRQLPMLPTEYLRDEEIIVLAAADHPILRHTHTAENGRRYIELEEVARHELILTAPNTAVRIIVEDLFREANLKLHAHYDNTTLAFGLAMARQGFGLLFTQESLVDPVSDCVRLSIGGKGVFRCLVLAYPNHQYRAEATKAFAREIHLALDQR